MEILLTALMCHMVPAVSAPGTVEACRGPEIVYQGPGNCNSSQMILAQWKGLGKYADDEWVIKKYDCGKAF